MWVDTRDQYVLRKHSDVEEGRKVILITVGSVACSRYREFPLL